MLLADEIDMEYLKNKIAEEMYYITEDDIEDDDITEDDVYISSCSDYCSDEKKAKFMFFDTARFALNNCQHASHHLQCILSYFIAGYGGLTSCPINDTPQCHGYGKGNNGEAHYWAPEDYYNFARAFLRTKALTDAFLKPQFR